MPISKHQPGRDALGCVLEVDCRCPRINRLGRPVDAVKPITGIDRLFTRGPADPLNAHSLESNQHASRRIGQRNVGLHGFGARCLASRFPNGIDAGCFLARAEDSHGANAGGHVRKGAVRAVRLQRHHAGRRLKQSVSECRMQAIPVHRLAYRGWQVELRKGLIVAAHEVIQHSKRRSVGQAACGHLSIELHLTNSIVHSAASRVEIDQRRCFMSQRVGVSQPTASMKGPGARLVF